ncbi:diaminopimelate decarboxylase [Tessaracoccus bendigoensis DSM 12906]|uniref:Diaminopimelate decarboxylase n=1 Tax=Tessaracoccus bendigoensis DSM 12906 TaxID=1123357 RepID=A0A1M6GEX4_9ACTN|nr:diaminopimelate decarboxylase [Tessaracoccus bendigoensis]SHJ08510.1 diaminopimelate decarboxylase [Tessaracoccus bendigoensis DSM 12906]
MTHMHIAGSIHADAVQGGPTWLTVPDDLNELDLSLWPRGTHRDETGRVVVAGVALTDVVAEHGTPVYVIDEDDFRSRARDFRAAFPDWDVYYAGKALLTRTVARWAAEEGLNLDVTTLGEMRIALEGGMPAQRLGFHGNNKSEEEIAFALAQGVGRIIVDSFDEIARLEAACVEGGHRAKVLVRVTTGVEAHTHEYIATAHEDQKFGLSIMGGQALTALVRCHSSQYLDLLGIHSHIGSQIFETLGFEVAIRRTMKLAAQFRTATGVELPELDLGGGFGIAYTSADTPQPTSDLAAAFEEMIEHECRAFALARPRLSLEPGRAICGPAGVAVYRVGTIKNVELEGGRTRLYVSVDGGMSDNIRPALYAAEYSAAVANRTSDAEPVLSRVVGKHCEGGDILIRDVFLPSDVAIGDLIAVPGAGAYARSMASNYNQIPKPPVVSAKDGVTSTMLRRETLDDLMRLDVGQ